MQASGRVAWKPIVGLAVGASARTVSSWPATRRRTSRRSPSTEPYTQRALGVDAEYSRDHWIVRGELIDSRWTLPAIAAPRTSTVHCARRPAFVEARYRFGPRYFAAARADRLTFSRIRGERLFGGVPTPWDAPVTRIEVGGGVYVRRTLTARAVVQHNWRDGGRVRERTFVSGQLAYWF